ncbi:hypothetical protein ABH15_06335 [Methanoculleus taiwanensis]|uniref:DUF61 family protein n=1 Tax=Methanoculleus taiwanensis TaxID=1550565 RepID=A0A498GYU3_9EURY|nr:DUF61 family protein [Methanoculleus taiwanensis]RXE55839.1 hypothetical protein ABH15_06335 [Methanoculleus taiwanensis]
MPDRPPLHDEAVLMRWMRLEIGKLNEGLVAERKTLRRLLEEEAPSSTTKSGQEYLFDAGLIRQLGEQLPPDLHRRLKLPMLFYFDMTVGGSCFLTEEAAMEALQHLGEISHLRRMREGRLWFAKPIAYDLMNRYPTVIQIVMR